MSIYRSAVNKPVTTFLVFLAFAILGLFCLSRLPIDFFPDVESNTIMVMSSYPGASAEDVENNLTKTLENTLNGVSNLKNITSQSRENLSFLTLEFEYGIDIEEATNDVRDKLSMISSTLPDGASSPVIFKFSAEDIPILMLSATARQSASALDKILDDKVATPLARVSGVGTVSVIGAPKREIQVYCDPTKLEAYHLSISTLASIIAAENKNVPSGSIDIGSETYTLRVKKEFKDPNELLDLVVGHNGANTIYLRDVARINDGLEERSQESFTGGLNSALIMIQKQSGYNSVNVVREVNANMEKIKTTLPPDIEFGVVFDTSDNIIRTINSLKETIMITFLVVMLIVYIFLGRWKGTLIVILSIPIALLASLMYLFATGNTLNIISMSALSIAIGMVVDDAIVVLENVTTHLERGEKPKEAAVHGTSEVGISVIASTLTMLCVFLPLTMIPGMAGIMFKQLGWIVSIIMIVSTTAALSLVPMMCSKMLGNENKSGKVYHFIFDPINRFLDKVSQGYSKFISWCMGHKKRVLLGAFVIFIAVMVFIGGNVKTEYFPRSDMGRISATIELPIGTSQDVTRDVAHRIYQKIAADVPEIQVFNYRFGQADSDNAFASMQANGTYIISMNINAGPKSSRKRTGAEIVDIVRADILSFPEVRKANVTEGQGGGMSGAASISVEIYGYDFEETEEVARALKAYMDSTGVFAQVVPSRDQYTPEYQVDFDRHKLAINGLTSTTAAAAVSSAMSGSVASHYREEGEEYDIRVRYAPEFRNSTESIGNIIVYTPAGAGVRIKDLGNVVEDKVPPTIQRKNRERYISLTGIIATSYALSDGVAVANEALEKVVIPSNINVTIGGDYEDQQDMFGDMFLLMILIVILVYMVMASQFESFMGPFVIMFSIPFALVGVLIGLWVTGTALGVMAMIGIIILLGIVVKNGIVLIDYTILCQERGMDVRTSSITAAKSRLRPILMTTLTTVLGMVPMAIGTGDGSEMWRSLGMTVVWGLSISTIITLGIIPTLYCGIYEHKEKRKAKRQARREAKLATAEK